jgi:hypothetical protein
MARKSVKQAILVTAVQFFGFQMVNSSQGVASTISRSQTISVIHTLSVKAQPWRRDGKQQKRSVRLEIMTGPVLKGTAQPDAKVAFTLEQWRDAGARITAPRGPWSRIQLETDRDLVIFSSATSGRWAEDVLPAVTSVCPATECLEEVQAGLSIDWDALQRLPESSSIWGPLLAEALVEKTLSFSRDFTSWNRALALFERQDLPVDFRSKVASELFASLALISPLPLDIAQRTMLFGVRLLGLTDANKGLHRNLLAVYLPNLLGSTGSSKVDVKTLLPSEQDRKKALHDLSLMPSSPERDRFIQSLKKD